MRFAGIEKVYKNRTLISGSLRTRNSTCPPHLPHPTSSQSETNPVSIPLLQSNPPRSLIHNHLKKPRWNSYLTPNRPKQQNQRKAQPLPRIHIRIPRHGKSQISSGDCIDFGGVLAWCCTGFSAFSFTSCAESALLLWRGEPFRPLGSRAGLYSLTYQQYLPRDRLCVRCCKRRDMDVSSPYLDLFA